MKHESKFQIGDRVAWQDANGDFRVGTIVAHGEHPDLWHIKTQKGQTFYKEDAELTKAGNLIDVVEATEQFREKLDSGYFDKANEELSGEEIDKLIKAVNAPKEVDIKSPTLIQDLFETAETGAVVKGRAKTFYIEDEWQKKYQEGYKDGHRTGEIDGVMNVKIDELSYQRGYQDGLKARDGICVGDEVHSDSYNPHTHGIVTSIAHDTICVLWKSGCAGRGYAISDFEKTGRHFDLNRIWSEMENGM